MPTRTFKYEPKSTVGIIFPIKIYTEVEFDCDLLAVDSFRVGGWNEFPIGITSRYDFHVSVEKSKQVPCKKERCERAIKWEFTLRYSIALVADVGLFGLDADVDTYDPIAEFESFTTECICCDELR